MGKGALGMVGQENLWGEARWKWRSEEMGWARCVRNGPRFFSTVTLGKMQAAERWVTICTASLRPLIPTLLPWSTRGEGSKRFDGERRVGNGGAREFLGEARLEMAKRGNGWGGVCKKWTEIFLNGKSR